MTSRMSDEELQRYHVIFHRYATPHTDGELYLDADSFLDMMATRPVRLSEEHCRLLFDTADRRRQNRVSLDDFIAFQKIISRPDAEYQLAYRVFDPEGSGRIKMERFRYLLRNGLQADSPPFDPDCDWLRLYDHAGVKGDGRDWWTYAEFAQLLRGLPGERLRQAFRHYDTAGIGYISPEAFRDMVASLARHRLSAYVLNNITGFTVRGRVNYATIRAFYNVVRQLDSIESVIRVASRHSHDGRIDRMDFAEAAAKLGRSAMFSPLEVNIIFHFVKLEHPGTNRFLPRDFRLLIDPGWRAPPQDEGQLDDDNKIPDKKTASIAANFGLEAARQAYSFVLGAIGGAVGATVVYPIDLVKTRMQNQRSAVVGELRYRNSMDCFRQVIRNEGVLGLYGGLGPQLVGVAPEKAIKLVMNDFVRSMFKDPRTGELKIWHEIAAGCAAGGSQVIFTNPLEIVKIRLQIQGEMAKVTNVPKRSAVHIVKELGLLGLYKGAGACLLRDIPFSGIYFTAYAHLKKDLFHEGRNNKRLSIWELLSAGAIAGMPAAYLTTPADVIKTRLQVEARQGQTQYTGIADAARKIYREEGFRAFFKGGPARVLRSSPQFGTTLMVYELLQNWLPFSQIENTLGWGAVGAEVKRERERTSIEKIADVNLRRTRRALRLLQDLDFRFGVLSPSVANAAVSAHVK
ncbi:mitochondrial carrier domain-containing protein [Syncephalis plumigaleata]|nr:mitochondrial carrier domain-containing protein [Syncephalis plumigaleata]